MSYSHDNVTSCVIIYFSVFKLPYENWEPGQPSNGQNNDCISMNAYGKMRDRWCSDEYNAICRRLISVTDKNCYFITK